MSPCSALVQLDEEVDRAARRRADRRAASHARSAAPRVRDLQIRRQLRVQRRLVGEREVLGVRLEEEVERVDHRHLGDQIDVDRELASSARGRRARARKLPNGSCCQLMKCVGRLDRQRVAEDRRAAVRRGTQPDDLRRQRDRPVVAVGACGARARRGSPCGLRTVRRSDATAAGAALACAGNARRRAKLVVRASSSSLLQAVEELVQPPSSRATLASSRARAPPARRPAARSALDVPRQRRARRRRLQRAQCATARGNCGSRSRKSHAPPSADDAAARACGTSRSR